MVAITSNTMKDEIKRQQALARGIAADQISISSGIKLTSASQDPLAWVQVSDLARAQSQQAAWQSNVGFGQARASKANSSLTELNNLYTRAQELLITGSTSALSDTGRAAVVAELTNIRAVANGLVNEKDYQGTPVFDDGSPTAIPVARGINIDAVATRQSVSGGINVNGTPMSLDDMLSGAIDAISTNNETARANALTAVKAGLDHIIGQQAAQGVRGERLDNAGTRLTDIDLELTDRRSKLESTDLTEAITGLQGKLLTLQAAQAAFAKINQQSLFDLLR